MTIPPIQASGPTHGPWAGRLAVAAACATWVLLLVGCLVHGTGSSLACPDWPLCFGSAFPKMENGVQYEHTHRLVATAVGLLTIALAVALHRRRTDDPKAAILGYVAVGLVCFQGLLGGVTVLLRLPILVTLMHLGTSMAFFCLTIVIALRVRDRRAADDPKELAALRPWVAVAVVATFAQIVLGGIVRHTSSGLACFGIPLCNGEVWPDHPGAHLHMLHRIFAVGLGTYVLALASASRAAPRSRVARLARLAAVLVLLQITLGVLSVLSLLALSAVTLHLGVAALLLACNVAIFYYLPGRMVTTEPATAYGEAAPSVSRSARDIAALTKPRITVIVVATCAAGMAIAPVRIPMQVALLAILGTSLIVASANVLNMWWERETDGLMARTRLRPLPAGRLSPDVALFFGLALGASSVPMLVAVNPLTAALGVLALVTYVLAYTPLKRHTSLALWVGAVPGAMPPLMGWTSATGSLFGGSTQGLAGLGGVLLFLLLFAWQLPHFNAIALFRAEDYAKAGLKVVSVERGERAAKGQIAGYTVLLVVVSLGLAASHVAGAAFTVSAAALGVLFLLLAGSGLRPRAGAGWARGVFAYSIVYLTLLLAILVADRVSV